MTKKKKEADPGHQPVTMDAADLDALWTMATGFSAGGLTNDKILYLMELVKSLGRMRREPPRELLDDLQDAMDAAETQEEALNHKRRWAREMKLTFSFFPDEKQVWELPNTSVEVLKDVLMDWTKKLRGGQLPQWFDICEACGLKDWAYKELLKKPKEKKKDD